MYFLTTREYTQIAGDINALYHEAAVRMGISDTMMNILYVICENGNQCLQSTISKSTGISRKTINSAIQKMKKEELITLQQGEGRNTIVSFTEQGKLFAEEKIYPLFEMEKKIWDEWTEEEQSQYLLLTKKYRDGLVKYMKELHI